MASASETAVGASSKTLTASEFLELVEQNRLVPPTILRQFHSNPMANQQDAREFAEILVDGGHLTRWQMERILAGKGGFTLGKYKLLDRIAAGGMGVILKAWQPSQKRTVAIKVLSRTMLCKAEAIRRFEREIAAASSLDHPHIVRALDADCINGIPFLVMEFVEGKTLSSLVNQKGPLPVDWACEFCRQSALGLQHAHQRKLVHRDIKPSNLLLTRKSPSSPLIVKILDFGLARFSSEESETTELTAQNQIFGTIDYIAPEQARSAKTADIRADIFSLGCTLFYILTGTCPFPGENVMEKLTARVTGEAPPIRTLRSEVPEELEQVLAKMLARNREDRYQTPEEVSEALFPFSVAGRGQAEPSSGVSRVLVHRRDSEPEPTATAAMEAQPSEIELDRFLAELSHSQGDEEARSAGSSSVIKTQFPLARRSRMLIVVLIAALGLGAILMRGESKEQPLSPTPAPLANIGWPGSKQDLIFSWQANARGNAAVIPSGPVKFERNGVLNFQGGTVRVETLENALFEACRQSNELTLELVFSPDDLKQTGPARIVSFASSSRSQNFVLGQQGDKLLLQLRTDELSRTGAEPETFLCKTLPRQSNHLLVTYRNGELLCYHGGNQVLKTTYLQGTFANWEPQSLQMGNDWNGRSPWHGKLERIAIYSRALPHEEALDHFHRYRSGK